MKLMVACHTLTWIEVDTVSGEVGPARVFNLPENVEVEGHELEYKRTPVVCAIDPEFDDRIDTLNRERAVKLVQDATGYEFVFEESPVWSVR